MDPPPTHRIKSKHADKLENYFVKLKLRRDKTSEKLDLYKLKMALFDNIDLEDILLFFRDSNTTLEASGTLQTSAKIQ